MHEYTVEFRIASEALDTASVTQALGLEPSLIREKGERKAAGKVWNESLWAYNGLPAGASKSWASLAEGLDFLLDKLEPLQPRIDEYKRDHDIFFWCGNFQSSFDGGPSFSARLLRRLADFGVAVYIENHFTD